MSQDPSSVKKFPCINWMDGQLYVDGKRVYGVEIPTIWDDVERKMIETAFWAGIKYGQHGTVS